MNKANICVLVLEEQWVGDLWPYMRGANTPPSSQRVEVIVFRGGRASIATAQCVCDYVGE